MKMYKYTLYMKKVYTWLIKFLRAMVGLDTLLIGAEAGKISNEITEGKINADTIVTPEQFSAIDKLVTGKMLAGLVDHTQLSAFASSKDIEKLAKEAHALGTASVCVNEGRIRDAADILYDLNSKVMVCCVVGFPLGAATSYIKSYSAVEAAKMGADEVDMVINVGYLKDKDTKRFKEDIDRVMFHLWEYTANNKKENVVLIVILENCYLTSEEIVYATQTVAKLAKNYLPTRNHSGLKVFVKTSTGFGTPAKRPVPKKDYGKGMVDTAVGATIEDVYLMRQAIDEVTRVEAAKIDYVTNNVSGSNSGYNYIVGIKAAGGVKDRETALKMMVAAGCLIKIKEEQPNGQSSEQPNEQLSEYKLRNNYQEFFRIGASATKEIVSSK